MAISFEQPQAYDPGVAEQYGYLQQMRENQARQQAARVAGGSQGQNGGGWNTGNSSGNVQGEFTPHDQGAALMRQQESTQKYNQESALQSQKLNQAEQIRVNKLQYGISAVQQRMNENSLDQGIGQDMILQMQTEVDPLVQRMNNSRVQVAEMEKQKMMDESAQQTSLAGLSGTALATARMQNYLATNTRPGVHPDNTNIPVNYVVDAHGVPTGGFFDQQGRYTPPHRERPEPRDTTILSADALSKARLDIAKHVRETFTVNADGKPPTPAEIDAETERQYQAHVQSVSGGTSGSQSTAALPGLNPSAPRTADNVRQAQQHFTPFDAQNPPATLKPEQKAEMQTFRVLSTQIQQAIGPDAPPPPPQGVRNGEAWQANYSRIRTQLAQQLHQKLWEARNFISTKGSYLGMSASQQKEYDNRMEAIKNEIATIGQRIHRETLNETGSQFRNDIFAPGGFGF